MLVLDGIVDLGPVDLGECWVGVWAVQTFLVAIHHRLPVVFSFISQALSGLQLRKVHMIHHIFQPREKFLQRNSVFGKSNKEESCGSEVTANLRALVRPLRR